MNRKNSLRAKIILLAALATASTTALSGDDDCMLKCQENYEKCVDSGTSTKSACFVAFQNCQRNCNK